MRLFMLLRGTMESIFSIGNGADADVYLEANVPSSPTPKIRYNHSTYKWEVSHNGVSYETITQGTGGSSGGSDFLVNQVFT